MHLSREQKAENLLRTLIKELKRTGRHPSQKQTNQVNEYSDVMTFEKVCEWKESGMAYDDTCTVTFIKLPSESHEVMANFLLDHIKRQFAAHTFWTLGSSGELCLYKIYADGDSCEYPGRPQQRTLSISPSMDVPRSDT